VAGKSGSLATDLDYRRMLACSPEGVILQAFRQEPENAELDRDNAISSLQGRTAGIHIDHSVADYILLKRTDPEKRAALVVNNQILLPPFEDFSRAAPA